MRSGDSIADLETFTVSDHGRVVDAADVQFWGVTFARDSDTFYATLATGGKTHLIKGSVSGRTAEVIHDNVECPSLSPDGTRIGYKKLVGDEGKWRFHVLDLATGADVALAETRSVDDQLEWLDDRNLLYHAGERHLDRAGRRLRHAARLRQARGLAGRRPLGRPRQPVEVGAPGLLGLAQRAAVERALERAGRVGREGELEARLVALLALEQVEDGAAEQQRVAAAGREARVGALVDAQDDGGADVLGLAREELRRALEAPRGVGAACGGSALAAAGRAGASPAARSGRASAARASPRRWRRAARARAARARGSPPR